MPATKGDAVGFRVNQRRRINTEIVHKISFRPALSPGKKSVKAAVRVGDDLVRKRQADTPQHRLEDDCLAAFGVRTD